MVNLTKQELKYLEERKQDAFSFPLYVTFNTSRSHLPPALKWRADQCHSIYLNSKHCKDRNYNFIFKIDDYSPCGFTFPNVVSLFLMEYNDKGELDYVINSQGGYFTFYVQLSDLDKYFKRYYCVTENKNTGRVVSEYTNKEGVKFKVVVNYPRRVVSLTNVKKLLVDNEKEHLMTAKAYCCKQDEFNVDEGIKIANQKWILKWRKWFDKLLNEEEAKTEIKSEKKEDKEDMNTKPIIKLTTLSDSFVGTQYGDFIVEGVHHRDTSKHVFWTLKCPKCGKEIIATKSNLNKGKVNVKCFCMFKECDDNEYADSENTNTTADFVSDSDNNQYIKKNNGCFVTGLSTEEDKDELKDSTKTISCTQKGNIFLFEEEKDLFSMPMWYSIAHCIPADKTLHGAIAKRVDNYWNISKALNEKYGVYFTNLVPGNVDKISNVYNLIATPRKHEKTTMKILTKCVRELADQCYEDFVYNLAMPRIGCGANGMKWDEVREMILDTFYEVYRKNDELYDKEPEDGQTIKIVVCNIPNKKNV